MSTGRSARSSNPVSESFSAFTEPRPLTPTSISNLAAPPPPLRWRGHVTVREPGGDDVDLEDVIIEFSRAVASQYDEASCVSKLIPAFNLAFKQHNRDLPEVLNDVSKVKLFAGTQGVDLSCVNVEEGISFEETGVQRALTELRKLRMEARAGGVASSQSSEGVTTMTVVKEREGKAGIRKPDLVVGIWSNIPIRL